GRTLEEELGSGWEGVFHPDDIESCTEAINRGRREGVPFTAEFRMRRGDGRYRWLLGHGSPLIVNGEVTGFIGSCVDISARKGAERAMELLADASAAMASTLDYHQLLEQ